VKVSLGPFIVLSKSAGRWVRRDRNMLSYLGSDQRVKPMPKPTAAIIASFRQRAARCEERARQVDNPTVRASIALGAATWTKIAERLTAELKADTEGRIWKRRRCHSLTARPIPSTALCGGALASGFASTELHHSWDLTVT
jgi:hypothetical protein